MKDQIIARIKAKYPTINLSKARLDAIADKLKVTEETEIDGKLDELNDIFPFAEIARQDDRLRTLDKKDAKPADDKKPDSEPQPVDSKADDEMPAWAKKISEKLDNVTGTVNGLVNGKTADSRKTQLETALKDASPAYRTMVLKDFDRITFQDDQAFADYVTEKVTDSADFAQSEANNGLSQSKPPVKASGNTTKTASKEQVDSVLKNIM